MRAQTRHNLKEDRFRVSTIEAAENAVHWTVEHKTKLMIGAIVLIVLLAAALGGWTYVNRQDERASADMSKVVRTLEAQIRPAGTPAQPDTVSFATSQERAAAAKNQLLDIVQKYPHTRTSDIAAYMLGKTLTDLGDTAGAERYLNDAVSGGNKDLSGLAKFSLAALYRQENKDTQAIDLYNKLIASPTVTVPKAAAQLELASLYQAKQQTAEAKRIYEQIQKDDPKSQAATVAGQKLADLK